MPEQKTNPLYGYYSFPDSRLFNVRYLQYAYPPPAVTTREAWEATARQVWRRVILAAGLYPTPPRTPLKARVWDRFAADGCTIEKAHFESRPGFLVTGNLFRPLKSQGRGPAILCPHGHWKAGRLEHSEAAGVPDRCMMLARMGFVVFAYDMVGYSDSCQVPHRWTPEQTRRMWLYGQGMFRLQLWNSLRAVDFLCELPDVDAERIGCTGASGGATQTYFLALLDERIKVTAPVCMMSSLYQGGCPCEEAPFLHLGDLTTLHVVGALAPRPTLLPSVTGDWSNNNPGFDVPAVRRIYDLYGAGERVANVHFDAGHNYGKDIRENVYAWFARWLGGDRKAGRRIAEPALAVPPPERMRLFPDGKPPRGLKAGDAMMETIRKEEARFPDAPPKSAVELRRVRKAWREMYGETLTQREPEAVARLGVGGARHEDLKLRTVVYNYGRYGAGESVPGVWVKPDGAGKDSPAVVVAHGGGNAALFDGNRPGALLRALAGKGVRVLAVDMLGKGPTARLLEHPLIDPQDPLYYAFNPSLTARRVQDLLTALAMLRVNEGVRRPGLIGIGLGGALAMLARPLAGPLSASVADLTGCADDDAFWMGEAYHPLVRKIGDLRAAAALAESSPLLLCGADRATAQWAKKVYSLDGQAKALRVATNLTPKMAAEWVTVTARAEN